jgi:hypothetical protein
LATIRMQLQLRLSFNLCLRAPPYLGDNFSVRRSQKTLATEPGVACIICQMSGIQNRPPWTTGRTRLKPFIISVFCLSSLIFFMIWALPQEHPELVEKTEKEEKHLGPLPPTYNDIAEATERLPQHDPNVNSTQNKARYEIRYCTWYSTNQMLFHLGGSSCSKIRLGG